MLDKDIFNRNLLSLSLQNKETLKEVSNCELSNLVTFKTSKTNEIIPVLTRNNREYSLHSLFDPEKEGMRYSNGIINGGYIVVFGLGAGYHIKELLKRTDINGILIIDKDIEILKCILTKIDLSKIFSDPRISILVDKSVDYILEYLPKHYLPAILGDFATISLRSRVDSDKEYFTKIFRSIQTVLNTLSDDFTVQSRFGKKWYRNTIANLSKAEKSNTVLLPQKKIAIAAAGPSLELHLDELKTNANNTFLISTDTALSCLLKNSIKPDLVISIDCQQITYHHFMEGIPKDIPLVLDLASPPFLARLTNKTVFFTSGHPFSQFINRNWRRFPYIDTSGGNVTHAAISLAEKLGARQIYIYGADFSYPQGKSYARGTYIYPYFFTKSQRTLNTETLFYNFLYQKDNIRMQKTEYGFRYITRPMLSYKERLEKLLLQTNSEIIPVKGLGEKIIIPNKTIQKGDIKTGFFSAGRCSSTWRDFLTKYKSNLKNLQVPNLPTSNYFSGLDYHEIDIWTTLFPGAALIRTEEKLTSSELLKKTKEWSIKVIDMYLDNSKT